MACQSFKIEIIYNFMLVKKNYNFEAMMQLLSYRKKFLNQEKQKVRSYITTKWKLKKNGTAHKRLHIEFLTAFEATSYNLIWWLPPI